MRFENKIGNHYKWYTIEVQPGPNDTFRVYTSWGRIGSANTTHKIIYTGDIDGAMESFQKKRKDRMKHGYTVIEQPED